MVRAAAAVARASRPTAGCGACGRGQDDEIRAGPAVGVAGAGGLRGEGEGAVAASGGLGGGAQDRVVVEVQDGLAGPGVGEQQVEGGVTVEQ